MEHAEEARNADGVLVVSAWADGADGRLLARVTMATQGEDETVEVVSTPADLHALVDRWLESLGA